MPILATMVVEYVADLSKLQSAVSSISSISSQIAESASSATDTMASGFDTASSSVQELADSSAKATETIASGFRDTLAGIQEFSEVAESAGVNTDRLSTLQVRAAEAASRLDLAQAKAALSLQNAADMAASGTASAEQIAVAQANAALAADRVDTAENNAAIAMERAAAEAQNLNDQMMMSGEKTSLFSGFLGGTKDALEGASGGLSGFIGGIGDSIGGMIDFGVHAAQNIFWLQMMGQMAVQTAQSLLQPGENAQQMQAAFTNLLGSTQAATDELQQLDSFASKTPFQTMDIDQAASQLVGFGISAQNVIPDLTAIGDSLSAVGKGSTANLDGVVNIFGKLQNTGHLTAGIMTELADRGINAWSLLEQQTGKTHAQLATMIKSGLVPADQAMDMLTKGIEANPLYQGGMQKQSQTFAGIMSTVKSNFDQALASFGSPILEALGPLFNNLGNTLASPSFKTFAGSVGQGIVNTFQGIGNFIKPLEPAFQGIATNVGKFFSAFKDPAIGKFASELQGDLKKALTWLVNALSSKQFGDFMHWVGTDLVDAIKKAAPVVKDVAKNVIDFAESISNHVKPIIQWWNDNWPTTAQVFRGVWEIIKGVVQAGWAIVKDIILIGLDIIGGRWGQMWRDVGDLFVGVWNGIKSFIKGVIDVVVGFFHGMYDTIVGHSIIPDLVNGVIEWFAKLPGKALDLFNQLKTNVINTLTNLATDALNAGSNIVKQIGTGITNGLHFVTDAIHNVTQWISDHLPHSPAKIGPLVDLEQSGTEISNQISKGMINGVPLIDTAMNNLVKPVTVGLKGTGTTSTGGPNQQTIIIEDKTTHIVQVDGKVLAQTAGKGIVKEMRGHGLKI